MKRTAILIVCLVCTCAYTNPASGAERLSACERIERQQQRVMQQLRRPHGAAAANRLHQRWRELREQAVTHCR